jgi:excisionase family DNA binding protein
LVVSIISVVAFVYVKHYVFRKSEKNVWLYCVSEGNLAKGEPMTDVKDEPRRLSAESYRLPTRQESESASKAVSVIARALAEADDLVIAVKSDSENIELRLPHSVGSKLMELLSLIAQGDSVTMVPYGAELTTQQAADILNVSRPHLVSLLDSGAIDHHRVGSHRRIFAKDVFAYQYQRSAKRKAGLRKLQQLGQEADALDE